MANLTTLQLLRLYIDDRDTGTGTVTIEDPELQDLLDATEGDVYGAAGKAWAIKAARVAQWYQVSLDGSFLSREQVFDHCMSMSKYYEMRSTSGTGGASIVSVKMDSSFVDEDEEAEFG